MPSFSFPSSNCDLFIGNFALSDSFCLTESALIENLARQKRFFSKLSSLGSHLSQEGRCGDREGGVPWFNLAPTVWVPVTDLPTVAACIFTDLLPPRDCSTRSAATERPLASAIAFCSVRALSR